MEGTIIAKKSRPVLLCLALLCLILPSSLWAAPLNSLPPEAETGQSYCLWLLWSPDKPVVTSLAAKVRAGANFSEAAFTAAQSGGKQARFSLDCLKAGEMDPVVFEVARRLKVGQTSTPFALAKGWAMIMRTTMAYRERGKALFDQGRHAQAERAFMRDVKLHPRDAAVWHLLALCRAAQRNLKGALEAIDRALALDPGNPGLIQDKATMLAYAGRLQESLALYRQADKSDPGNPTVQSNMAWVLSLMNKDLAKAQILAAKAVSARPDNGRFWYTLGLVYQARGNLKDAVKALEQAASLPGAPPEVLKKLALAKRELAKAKPAKPRQVAKAEPPQKIASEAPKHEKQAAADKPAQPVQLPEKPAAPAPEKAPAKADPPEAVPALPKPEKQAPPKKPVAAAPEKTPAKVDPPEAVPALPKPENQAPPKEPVVTVPDKAPARARPERPVEKEEFSEAYLQVATALDRKMALEELAPLLKAGYEPFVRDWKDSKGRTWMAFYLGPFKDVQTAADLGQKLREKEVLGSYLVRTMKPGFRQRLGREFDYAQSSEPEPEAKPTAKDKPEQLPEPVKAARPEKPASKAEAKTVGAQAVAKDTAPDKAPTPEKPAAPVAQAAPQKAAPADTAPEEKPKPEAAAKPGPKEEPAPAVKPEKQSEPEAPEPPAQKAAAAGDTGDKIQDDKPAAAKAAPVENEVYLQIATLPNEKMAKVEAGGLIRAGYDPFVRTWRDRRGHTWEVVYLGPLDSKDEAEKLARKLKDRRLIHSFDVRTLETDFRAKRGRPLARENNAEKTEATKPEPTPEPKPTPEPEPAPRSLKPVVPPPPPEPAPAAELKPSAPMEPETAPKAKPADAPRAEAPPAPRPVVPLRPAGPSETYLVVSAHPDRAGAYTAASRFRKAGYKTRLSAWPRQDGKVWQRVMVGPFASREDALEAAGKLQKKGLVEKYELLVRE